MGKNILWLQQKNNLLAYKISDASTKIFSQNTILPSSVNLIGAQRYQDYVYTAQPRMIHIFLWRNFLTMVKDANWAAYFSLPNDYNTRQLHIESDTYEHIISFPHVVDLYQYHLSNNFYVTIKLPPRGGIGEWRYGNESFIQTLLPVTEPPTFENATIVNSTDVNPNDNDGNGGTIAAGILVPIFLIGSSTAAAVATVIVCHKKKVTYFVNLEEKLMPHLKKCYVNCKKTEASDL